MSAASRYKAVVTAIDKRKESFGDKTTIEFEVEANYTLEACNEAMNYVWGRHYPSSCIETTAISLTKID